MGSGEYRIIVYLSICTPTHLYVKGRVMKIKRHVPRVKDGPLHVITNSFLRFNSEELGHAKLSIDIDGFTYEVIADDEGFFTLYKERDEKINYQLYDIYLYNAPNDHHKKGFFFHTLTKDSTGVITDIDDTMLETGVTSFLKLKLIVNSIMVNPFRRKTIEGAAEFLRYLDTDGPYFYVSNSPWNIVDYLQTFLKHNDFPNGTLILRDIDFSLKRKSIEHSNKYMEIKKIISIHRDYRFILIGDAAEKDIDIYIKLLTEFPSSIESIYIRKTGKDNRDLRVANLANAYDNIHIVDKFEDVIRGDVS